MLVGPFIGKVWLHEEMVVGHGCGYFRKVAYNSKLNAYNSLQIIMLRCNVDSTIF